eukprot:3692783-Pleurochrysis_carterae.AAC.1
MCIRDRCCAPRPSPLPAGVHAPRDPGSQAGSPHPSWCSLHLRGAAQVTENALHFLRGARIARRSGPLARLRPPRRAAQARDPRHGRLRLGRRPLSAAAHHWKHAHAHHAPPMRESEAALRTSGGDC